MNSSDPPIQTLRICYRGSNLDLVDSDDHTLFYQIRVGRHTPQFRLIPIQSHTEKPSPTTDEDVACTALFKKLSLEVRLCLHGQDVMMTQPHTFSRTYEFDSPTLGRRLAWEAVEGLKGDFRLVESSGMTRTILAQFNNKMLSNKEVGSFEIMGGITGRLRDEVVITGLSELVMMQSLNLASMVLFG